MRYPVNISSIQLEDVHEWDAPDFSDAFAVYAEFTDGTPLTEEELENLEPDLIHQAIWENL